MSEELIEAAAPAEEVAPLPSGRVPHLGHALLFFTTAGLLLLVAQAILLLPKMPAGISALAFSLQHPKLLLAAEGATYTLTLLLGWFLFPLLWRRSFAAGLDWNGAAAIRQAGRLIPFGLCTGWAVQAISSRIAMPKTVPMDSFFRSQSDVWLVTIFGTLVAPLFEEVCFRGFLLPACAIAWDWLGPMLRYLFRFSTSRIQQQTPELTIVTFREPATAGIAERAGNMAHRSVPAIAVSSVATSVLFGLMHAQQLGYTWAAVVLLSCVSLLLTVVRLRTRSVACSTLVHGSYNFSVFLTLFLATGGYRHLDRMAR